METHFRCWIILGAPGLCTVRVYKLQYGVWTTVISAADKQHKQVYDMIGRHAAQVRRYMIGCKSLKVRYHVTGGQVKLPADEGRLQQIGL